MAWDPVSTDLGSVDENINFSHTITYEELDPLISLMVSYPVTITANETNPSSVVISGNTIFGYYFDSFDYSVQYRTEQGNLPIVSKFSEIDISSLQEMISYKASLVLSKTFSYTAVAKDTSVTPNVIKATQVYTKTVTNNWTAGKNLLQQYVGYTV